MIINGTEIAKGQRQRVDIDIARLYDATEMMMSVEVVRGQEDGPVMFLSAAVHGDEVNGTEIIRRVLAHVSLQNIRGTILAVPVVNTYGFNTKSRYLPDRRDLNRCFPGGQDGSLAARLAHSFISEIVSHSTHGIDYHTGAVNRYNYPQIRACLSDTVVADMARLFNAPLTLDEPLREGTLREYCYQQSIPTLLFEGGEALRYCEKSIQCAVEGTLSVLAGLGMIDHERQESPPTTKVLAESHWLRAPESGLFVTDKQTGDHVKEGEEIGYITDPFNHKRDYIYAMSDGVILGATTSPLLNEGDATFHIGHYA